MAYLGNQPALAYTSFAKQDFTTSATTSYTLDNPVANENEIALFINFVRQEPTTAYTASGTSLTLTSATSASDDMYCVYLGKAVQTINPPVGSVGTSQLEDGAVTSAKLASSATNTPAFLAKMSTNPQFSDGVTTKLTLDTEVYDTDSAYDATTNYRFTVPSGKAGKYYIYGATQVYANSSGNLLRLSLYIYINGSLLEPYVAETDYQNNYIRDGYENINVVLDLSEGDYIELYANGNTNGGQDFNPRSEYTYFGGYKLVE